MTGLAALLLAAVTTTASTASGSDPRLASAEALIDAF